MHLLSPPSLRKPDAGVYMVEMQITALGAFSLFKQLKMRPGVTCGSAEDGKSLFSQWMLQSALRWMNEFGSQTASDGKLYEHISPKCPIEAVKLWDWTRRSHSLWDEIMILQNTLIFSNSLLTKEAGWLTPAGSILSLTLSDLVVTGAVRVWWLSCEALGKEGGFLPLSEREEKRRLTMSFGKKLRQKPLFHSRRGWTVQDMELCHEIHKKKGWNSEAVSGAAFGYFQFCCLTQMLN